MYEVKQSIKSFVRYKPNTTEYDLKLDANESRYNENLLINKLFLEDINLYPDHYAVALREAIASYQNVTSSEVLVGNGSSELLELVIKTFVNPNDVVLSVEPSFVMYEKYTMLSNGVYKKVSTNNNYEIAAVDIINAAKKYQPKIIFLCTPNNPTGYLMKQKDVLEVVKQTSAIVVVDEAYMEFADEDQSVISKINEYSNLIVNRTFSKAFGLAGARLGYFITNTELVNILSIAKTPYGVNTLTQRLGILSLQDLTYIRTNVSQIKMQRSLLETKLNNLGIQTFPSNANFIFCEFEEFDIAKELEKKKILIRTFNNGTYRITVGTEKQNKQLIQALEELFNERS